MIALTYIWGASDRDQENTAEMPKDGMKRMGLIKEDLWKWIKINTYIDPALVVSEMWKYTFFGVVLCYQVYFIVILYAAADDDDDDDDVGDDDDVFQARR